MKYRSRSQKYPINNLEMYFRVTPFSTKLYVSRNGIILDLLASISVQQHLLLVAVDYSRLMYWLNKGIHINVRTSSSVNSTFQTFFHSQTFLKKKINQK